MSKDDVVEVKTRVRRTRRLKMSYNISQTDGSRVAAIRVSGKYLEDLGFDVDGFFDLTINEDGTLNLRPVSPEQNKLDDASGEANKNA